jgi:hypothetical protein
VLGFDAQGTFAALQTLPLDTTVAPPQGPRCFPLAAADLNDDGRDEVVVGYPTTYGGIAGAAALLLLVADPTTGLLTQTSYYVAANTANQPLASIDLHLAAGLFGDGVTRGVLVLGAGASLADLLKGQAQILAGLVAVDPTTQAFPPIDSTPATLPFVTAVSLIPPTSRFFGLGVDLRGLSVVLGTPTFQQVTAAQQILAILYAPPWDAAYLGTPPSLTFTTSDTTINGYNVASNKTWLTSTDVGGHLGIEGLQIGTHITNSYGTNFDQLSDNSTITGVQMSDVIATEDMVLTYAMDYWVWSYPVYRSAAASAPDGTLLVLFPALPHPIQELTSAYGNRNFGYHQPFENGCLLSYVAVAKAGYDPARCLFTPVSLPVTTDPSGASVTYDQSKSVGTTVNQGYNVHNTTADSATFAASTLLFDYLPVAFGLNLGGSENYSDSEMTTTTLTRTNALTIGVVLGSVGKIDYEYQVIPYVYQHQDLGCLVVAYDVQLVGAGWATAFSAAYPMLVLPFRANADSPLLAAFSRSISFSTDTATDDVHIQVEIFNRSLGTPVDAVCDVYAGQPSAGPPLAPPPDSQKIGTISAIAIPPLGRQTVTLPWPKAILNSCVTVRVYGGSRTVETAEIAWNIYPPAAFATLPV